MYQPRRGGVALPLVVAGLLGAVCQTVSAQTHLISSTTLNPGARVDYSRSLGILTYDKTGPDGYFDTYTMRPDGSNIRCLTCSNPLLSGAHNGNPAWHPSGKYILFQATDPSLQILPSNWVPITYRVTNPGYGTNNNLWLMTSDGSQMWKLTSVVAGQGVLHAHFNPSGNKIVFARKIDYRGPDQQWTITFANLVWTNGVPSLTNYSNYQPFGTNTFYETFGYSPDGASIIFSQGAASTQTLNLFTYNLVTGVLSNLTNTGTGVWNEHAHFAPDSSRIIYGSSAEITTTREYFVPFLDYWSMNLDGSNKVRLTYFNDATAPEYYPLGLVTADFDFGPTATTIFGSLEKVQADNSMFYTMDVLKFAF